MKFSQLHSWNLSPEQAIKLQRELASSLVLQPLAAEPQLLAAADVSFDVGGEVLFAAVAVFQRDNLSIVEEVTVKDKVTFPYIPGLLSFRELPILLQGFAQLRTVPDLVICDGQGIAHPRRLGIASHLGLWLGIPTIGSAKCLLCGKCQDPELSKGSVSPIIYHHQVVGMALRSRTKMQPIYVSPGHLCDLSSSVAIVSSLTPKYRIPIPIRYAHNLCNAFRKESAHHDLARPSPLAPFGLEPEAVDRLE